MCTLEVTIRNLAAALQHWGAEPYVQSPGAEQVHTLVRYSAQCAPASGMLIFVSAADLAQVLEEQPAGCYLVYCPESMSTRPPGWPSANVLFIWSCPDEELLWRRVKSFLDNPVSLLSPAAALLNSLSKNQFQATLNISACLLGNPVGAFDTSMGLLGSAPVGSFPMENQQPDFPCYAIPPHMKVSGSRQFVDKLYESNQPFLATNEEDGVRYLYTPVLINGVVVAFCVVREERSSFSELERRLLPSVVQAISLELQKNEVYKNRTGLLYEYFLIKLIENRSGNREFVDIRMQNLHLRETDAMYIAAFRFDAPQANPRRIRTISQELRELLGSSLTAVYNEHVVALIIREVPPFLSPSRLAALEQFLAANQLVAGVSFRFSDLSRAREYFRQALDAIGVGQRMAPDQRFHRLRDLVVYELFSICNLSLDLQKYVLPELRLLAEYDCQHQTELYQTLYQFFQCGLSRADTAKQLHIHRNTLLYRLEKIQEITGLTWDGDALLNCLLSFRLLNYLDRSGGEESDKS